MSWHYLRGPGAESSADCCRRCNKKKTAKEEDVKKIEIDMWWLFWLLLIVLFAGEPDLLDVLIDYVSAKARCP